MEVLEQAFTTYEYYPHTRTQFIARNKYARQALNTTAYSPLYHGWNHIPSHQVTSHARALSLSLSSHQRQIVVRARMGGADLARALVVP